MALSTKRIIAGAIAVLSGLCARHPDDKALANLLERTRHLSAGNAFVLG